MDPLIFVIAAAVFIPIACEGVLWGIFHQKLLPLVFPHELDTSFFRFFSMRRLGIIAILHTLFVVTCIVFCCLYLW